MACIPGQEGLVQLFLHIADAAHDVLDGFGHVVLCHPVQDVSRVGPQRVRKNGNLRTNSVVGMMIVRTRGVFLSAS